MLVGIASEEDWLTQLRADHEWFLEQLKGYGPGPTGNPWTPVLHQWCTESVKSFKPWIGRATMHATLQRQKEVDWWEWHFGFLTECIRVGLQLELPQPVQDSVGHLDTFEACLPCMKVFRRKLHGRFTPFVAMDASIPPEK